jgi:hypothetical protein
MTVLFHCENGDYARDHRERQETRMKLRGDFAEIALK